MLCGKAGLRVTVNNSLFPFSGRRPRFVEHVMVAYILNKTVLFTFPLPYTLLEDGCMEPGGLSCVRDRTG